MIKVIFSRRSPVSCVVKNQDSLDNAARQLIEGMYGDYNAVQITYLDLSDDEPYRGDVESNSDIRYYKELG